MAARAARWWHGPVRGWGAVRARSRVARSVVLVVTATLVALVGLPSVASQAAGDIAWTRDLGTNVSSLATGVTADENGVVAASVEPINNSWNPSRWMVQAYKPDGTFRWSQSLTAPGSTRLEVTADGLGNTYAVGLLSPSEGPRETLVAKYGPTGTELWSKRLAFTLAHPNNAAAFVSAAPDGVYLYTADNQTGILHKIPADGSSGWRFFFPPGDTHISGLAADAKGASILGSGSGSGAGLKRIDRDGNFKWSRAVKPYGDFDGDVSLASLDGTSYLVEYFDDPPGVRHFVLKAYDEENTLRWTRPIEGIDPVGGRTLAATTDGLYLLGEIRIADDPFLVQGLLRYTLGGAAGTLRTLESYDFGWQLAVAHQNVYTVLSAKLNKLTASSEESCSDQLSPYPQVQSKEFPIFRFPPQVRKDYTQIDEITFQLSLNKCGKVTVTLTPWGDPSLGITTENGLKTTVSKKGSINTYVPITEHGQAFWNAKPDPPTITGSYAYSRSMTAASWELGGQFQFDHHIELHPSPNSLGFVTALAAVAAVVGGLVAAYGLPAAGAATALGTLFGLIVLPTGPAGPGHGPGNGPVSFAPQPSSAIVRPSAATLDNLKLVLGNEYVAGATVSELWVDGTGKQPGSSIQFRGAGFQAGARVDVMLARVDGSAQRVSKAVRADTAGRIDDVIQIPSSVPGGTWVLAANDASLAYAQLREVVQGRSTAIHGYLAANEVAVGGGAPQCSPRPPVRLSVVRDAPGLLRVAVTATTNGSVPTNAVSSITFDAGQSATGATIDIGGQQARTGRFTYTPPPGTSTVTFQARRVTAGTTVTVPVTVVDHCGAWTTFVGGGPSAF
jgi:hypothetical protein